MPRRSELNRSALKRKLDEQYQVITRQQAISFGVPRRTLDHWTAPGGRWQRLLPGLYSAVTGTITADQRHVAALLYAGPDSVITGPEAMRLHHLHPGGPETVDVLVPAAVKSQNAGFVRVHWTTRMPGGICRTGSIRFAGPARATADAARGFRKLDDVRDAVAQVVQQRKCSVADLITELRDGPKAGSLLLCAALTELGDGIRSASEAGFRALLAGSAIPQPMFNAKLYTREGVFLAMVDAWWRDAGVAAEVDSRAHHTSVAEQEQDARRHDRLIAKGVLLLHFRPRRIKTDGQGVVTDVASAVVQGRGRPRLAIVAIPADDSWEDFVARKRAAG